MKRASPFLTVLVFAAVAAAPALPVPVALQVDVSNPFLEAGRRQVTYLRVGLTGQVLARSTDRAPGNIAIVLDRSGSMQGEKIERAKEAALMAIDMLDERDIVSVLSYSDTVHVMVPATRVSDRYAIQNMIRRLQADGNTALFAGVSRGASELRKFLDRNRVNRVILLSDGLANVGPGSPGALGDLGASLKREGISVTTIGLGLGYNEDLMVRLARESDGNHAFVENSADLVRIFNREFNDILSVVAREVQIEIECRDGVRPVRLVGRDGRIVGDRVIAGINEIYGGQEKYFLLEVEVPEGDEGQSLEVARVRISYADPTSRNVASLTGVTSVSFTRSQAVVEENLDRDVMSNVVIQQATERNEKAVQLRDEGRIEEARALLLENAEELRKGAASLAAPELEAYGQANLEDAANLDDEAWEAQRKRMLESQHENRVQQSY
jgi:Ca-activated chloride channel family protein